MILQVGTQLKQLQSLVQGVKPLNPSLNFTILAQNIFPAALIYLASFFRRSLKKKPST